MQFWFILIILYHVLRYLFVFLQVWSYVKLLSNAVNTGRFYKVVWKWGVGGGWRSTVFYIIDSVVSFHVLSCQALIKVVHILTLRYKSFQTNGRRIQKFWSLTVLHLKLENPIKLLCVCVCIFHIKDI